MRQFCYTVCFLFFIFSACSTPIEKAGLSENAPHEINSDENKPPSPIIRNEPSASPLPSAEPLQVEEIPTSTPHVLVCLPLDGITLEELSETIHNPFNPPAPGRDDPHMGIDFAIQQYGMAVSGGPVHAVLGGRVASVVDDRFPYGNALVIETPLDFMPPEWVSKIKLPTPAPTIEPHPALNCPTSTSNPTWNYSKRSLYLLYAHLLEPVVLQPEELVECGQVIGLIGSSGNALNPHLHLEIRLGPGGARFTSMSHYSTSASPEEMSNYCTWRVTETFQLMDPMQLFVSSP
jgi:murein DD-endopeptidase MepM/ murein hydrolase activator NlpD